MVMVPDLITAATKDDGTVDLGLWKSVQLALINHCEGQANRMAADIWPDARLSQGRGQSEAVRVRGTVETSPVFLAEVKYPGDACKLELLVDGQSGTAQTRTVEIPTAWTPVYLIDKYEGTRSADGKTWEVEVRLPDEKDPAVVWSFWVKIVLEGPLPELDQWVK